MDAPHTGHWGPSPLITPAGFRVTGKPQGGTAEAPCGCRIGPAELLEQFGLLLILERSSSCIWYEA